MRQFMQKFPFMLFRAKFSACLILALSQPALSQKLKKSDRAILANLESEIRYLADDRLEGRRTGTTGEKMASDYLIAEFEQIKLAPAGANGTWLQAFPVDDGKQVNPATCLVINQDSLRINADYFPLPYSASLSVSGSPAMALQERGVPWFVDLKETLESNQGNPHFSLDSYLHGRIRDCVKKGATAVIIYNSSKIDDGISFDAKDRSAAETVPIMYVTGDARRKYLHDESASMEIHLTVDMSEKIRTGHNVAAYLDNGAPGVVVIGAHYDHLGYGEDGNSLYRGKERLVHNGADDNASGTAAMIELARLLKTSKFKNYNYLFLGFSGEELGLLGSKYFTEHPTIDLARVDYMINMDMVGRLNDSTHALTIGGYGTSPSWGELFRKDDGHKYFQLKYDSSGTGPSDYTSFYLKNIPVLFFFTGIHEDYHKPTDDYDKINYSGELEVVKYIFSLVEILNGEGRLTFSKTRENQMATRARFSVTLGILPDYSYTGAGVRVDGVSDGRPAQLAGLQAGDIIVKLGEFPVSSLESYMEALSKFKKGDRTHVQYRRGKDLTEAPVVF